MNKYLTQLLAFIGIFIGVALLASGVSVAIWMWGGLDVLDIENSISTINDRIYFRWGLIVNHFLMFTGSALLFSWIYYKSEWGSYFSLDKEPNIKVLLLWGLLILCSYPFLGGLAKWNELIPFPEWMISNQNSSFEIMSKALTMNNFYELFQGIVLVGLMAGLGEELVFRGIVQKNLSKVFSSPHTAIWVAAIIFGSFHMQAERFFPLSFLGLLLGYSYYYTKSLLVPILLHLLNNSIQVLGLYILKLDPTEQLTGSEDIPMLAIICSGLITFVLFYYLGPRLTLSDESRP